MKEWSIVATNHEHLILTQSPGILLFLWKYTEIFPPVLLYHPTSQDKHTLLCSYTPFP